MAPKRLISGLAALLCSIAAGAQAEQQLDLDTTYVVTLGQNVILADTPFYRIGSQAELLRIMTDAQNDAADVDVHVRYGMPLDQSTVGSLVSSATASADGPGGDKQLVLDRLTQPRLRNGKWYLQLINRSGPETDVQFRAEVDRAPGGTAFMPKAGMWWNPDRPGHGLDVQKAGDSLVVVWFTYLSDGTPVWYLAVATLEGTTWTADLDLFTWNWNQLEASSETVGTLELEFDGDSAATMNWSIDGQGSGSEPMERFIALPAAPPVNLTGHWFEAARSGYGATLLSQSDVEVATLYLYDGQGNARWTQGVLADAVAGQSSYELLQFTGFCPSCPFVPTTNRSVGEFSRSFDSNTEGVASIDVDWRSPLPGRWQSSQGAITRLSDVPPGGPVTLSTTTAKAGQVVEVASDSIVAGSSAVVVFTGEDGIEVPVETPVTADGAVRVQVPNQFSGNGDFLATSEVQVSVGGVSADTTLDVEQPTSLEWFETGELAAVMMDISREQYRRAGETIARISNGQGIDDAQIQAGLAAQMAVSEAAASELRASGQLEVLDADGEPMMLDAAAIRHSEIMMAQAIQGLAAEINEQAGPVPFTKNGKFLPNACEVPIEQWSREGFAECIRAMDRAIVEPYAGVVGGVIGFIGGMVTGSGAGPAAPLVATAATALGMWVFQFGGSLTMEGMAEIIENDLGRDLGGVVADAALEATLGLEGAIRGLLVGGSELLSWLNGAFDLQNWLNDVKKLCNIDPADFGGLKEFQGCPLPVTPLSVFLKNGDTRLEVGEAGNWVLSVTGGLRPYSGTFEWSDGRSDPATGENGTLRSGRSFETAGQFSADALVSDPLGGFGIVIISVNVEEGEEEPPAAELEVAITSDPGIDYCRETTLTASIDGGDPPFDYAWTLGDGTVVNDRTSSRTLRIEHMFQPDTSMPYQVVVEVEDSEGVGGRGEQTVSHDGRREQISVRLRNDGVDNIHIFNKDELSPAQYFSSATRISDGSSRNDAVTIPADRCGVLVEWGAGRQGTQLASTSCAYKKGESGGSVNYSEVSFSTLPLLSCGG